MKLVSIKATGTVFLLPFFYSLVALKKKTLEMCQYETDAPHLRGNPHPETSILLKMKLIKVHNSNNYWQI